MKKPEVEQSSSKRHFHWTTKVSHNEDEAVTPTLSHQKDQIKTEKVDGESASKPPSEGEKSSGKKLKLHGAAISRLRSLFGKNIKERVVIGTLFGSKWGSHVIFAFQKDAKLRPTLFFHLSTPITGLAREMGLGSTRIALETEKKKGEEVPLLEERDWRTYCNGMKLGPATRMECGPKEWKILEAIGPVSTGAGVLPTEDEEVIYMRAKFERVVGNTDSEALYMVNPDNNLNVVAPPELSIYMLRL